MKTATRIRPERATIARETSRAVDAFLFDVDGVLADTAFLHTQAWARMAAEEGLPFDEDCAAALRGISRESSLLRILNGRTMPDDQFRAMLDRKNRYYVELLSDLSPGDALPGVFRLLDELLKCRIRVAAVSASRNARCVLERIGLVGRFEFIVDGNEESPFNRYLLAARKMGIMPQHCVVVDDSAAGVVLARREGMCAIGLGMSDDLQAADLVLESLADASVDVILTKLFGREITHCTSI
jgi:beta-phosphoglucomutase